MTYATIADIKARTTDTIPVSEEAVITAQLEDAAVIIDAYNKDASLDAKKVVSCRMIIRTLNSVGDIRKILKTYSQKSDGLLDIADVSVVCADTSENRAELKKINAGIRITKSVPKTGEPHPTWTFCTRTCFVGVDFYSPLPVPLLS